MPRVGAVLVLATGTLELDVDTGRRRRLLYLPQSLDPIAEFSSAILQVNRRNEERLALVYQLRGNGQAADLVTAKQNPHPITFIHLRPRRDI